MAVAVWNIAWFMLAFIPFCCSRRHILNNFELHKLCNETVDMEDINVTSGVFKLFNSEATYTRDFLCEIKLKAPSGHRVLLRFANSDIMPSDRIRCGDNVWINEKNPEWYIKKFGDDTHKVKLCGNDPPDKTYRSHEREIVIDVHLDGNPLATDEGYKIFFNAFHTGTCKGGEFKCDSGYCIDADLKCNGYNNCGDGSDKCSSLVPILAGAAAAVFLLCLSLGCLYCCRKERSRQHGRKREETDATEITLITSQVADVSSPWYVSVQSPSWEQVPPPESAHLYDRPVGYPSVPTPNEGTNRPPKYSAYNKGYQGQEDAFQSAPLASQDNDSPPKYSPPAQGYPMHG